ncbi:hypothetical protein [Ruegeria arenilitoris]|uniref:hypothetical protein n=1 Tax=Ruegeria arenilitoris TaxID=1173585 RepID=UPI001480800B|nr:hypothetical protein [Ruegeria arenilitoris]
MKEIKVSTDVFALIWSLRIRGEENEDDILRRVLSREDKKSPEATQQKSNDRLGLVDRRFGVQFSEGFQIHRTYLGKEYQAIVVGGQWQISGLSGRYSTLNELSRAIGTKTENAWANWFFIDAAGRRKPVSVLRDPNTVTTRNQKKAATQRSSDDMMAPDARWCDDVRSALDELGGRAHLSKIYDKVEEIRQSAGRSTPKSLEEVVRKELEMRSSDSEVFDAARGEDWFCLPEGKGAGIWALRN